jgi:hypothetical protein
MNLEEVLKGQGGEAEAVRPRFVIRNLADALKPQPPIVYLVDKLIKTGTLSVFFGEPGSKKTYSLLSMAVCAAAGKDWLEFAIPEPVKVLIIDEESGERRLAIRLADAVRGELATEADPTYITYVSLAGFDLGNKNDAKEVSKLIMDVGAQIVIIDALADVMSGDENSKQETQPVLNHLRKIAEDTDSALILIHHSNKGGAYRGTSAIKGSVDLMVKVESENDSKFVNFTTEKNRDGEPLKWSAVAIWADDRFSMSPAEPKENTVILTKPKAYVLRYLLEHGESPAPEIINAADTCSPAAAKSAIYALTAQPEPYTVRTNPGETLGAGHYAIYALTQAGKKRAEEVSK